MGGLIESAKKEWYRLTTRRRLARDVWSRQYWIERDGERIVPCVRCPNFDAARVVCKVPFGSPLRKCVVASVEAHLRGARGKQTLELGFGRRSLGRQIVEASGGFWTGLEPDLDPRAANISIGEAGFGHAGEIPFPDETFDGVFGIQSLEHWEEPHPNITTPKTYAECLQEVWRVLKPGGSIYFDAPIHLHGHEMFVMGDVPRILGLFDPALWTNVVSERWRFEHEPLPKYPTPEKESGRWPDEFVGYSRSDVDAVRSGKSVWLFAVTARKRAA